MSERQTYKVIVFAGVLLIALLTVEWLAHPARTPAEQLVYRWHLYLLASLGLLYGVLRTRL